ncbi:MAG: 50S ribosomal protein L22 [Deltaproteobacteria bacterium]|jgi:large subunit ribosomal protein L22|nr:50S ribosomal protein L22 [Deltaproteobacteria bacterium]MDO9211204.1 50S ribosomal protein L22 [Deltaproteobacteria bacterium]MDP3040099.1 50S ribosomal protein L22 [Deltaproteobacteria bacterium]
METQAIAKHLRVSPRKVRLSADLVRGKRVEEALNILSFTPKTGAKVVSKVVRSALANARQNKSIDVDTLLIKTIFVNQGPTLKRFRPMPRGRAGKIRKRTCHITVVLSEP